MAFRFLKGAISPYKRMPLADLPNTGENHNKKATDM